MPSIKIVAVRAVWIGFFSSLIWSTPTFAQPYQTEDIIFLDQAWSVQDRAEYYWGPQGSALLSYDIYLALPLAGTEQLFNSPKTADKFGLLNNAPDPKNNPDALPIGIAKSEVTVGQFKGAYAGLTCAACHTGQLQYKGKQIRIDGGTGNRFDLYAWIKALSASLSDVNSDSLKFAQLLERARARGPVDEQDFRDRLAKDSANVNAHVQRSFTVPFPPGPGRADGLESISNSITSIYARIPENSRPSLAPVKPPFLWNAPHAAWVEWSGVIDNPLHRNYGETLGVFARYDLTSDSSASGLFESTTDIKGLIHLERLLRRLAPPKWPESVLGALDQGQVKVGAELFEKHCVECHTTYPYRWSEAQKQGVRHIENAMVEKDVIGTDDAQLLNAIFSPAATTQTGQLSGYFKGQQAVPRGLFNGVMMGAMINRSVNAAGPFTPEQVVDMNGYVNFGAEPRRAQPKMSYKASTRDGAWSNGPFLHNGSVPNLYELLLPVAERSKTFYLGGDFDPLKLGLDTSMQGRGYLFDTSLIGNSNAGHAFEAKPGKGVIGPELSDYERYALIEYLKSIPEHAGRVTPYGGPESPLIATDDPVWYNTRHPYAQK
jgi:mono/diheme cytochrome c family protein